MDIECSKDKFVGRGRFGEVIHNEQVVTLEASRIGLQLIHTHAREPMD